MSWTAIGRHIGRCVSLVHHGKGISTGPTPHSEMRLIYRFPYIVHAKMVCKAKIYQTGLVAALSASQVMTVPWSEALVPISTGVLSVGLLTLLGEFCRRFIGAVYVDDVSGQVRLSHLNFWGGRRDLTLPLDHVASLELAAADVTAADPYYVKVYFRDGVTRPLNLSVRFGTVIDPEAFNQVFHD